MNNYFTIEPQESAQGPNYSYWQPEAYNNNNILANSGITSNWKYRQYMQKNANQIMKYNSMEAIYSSGNNPYAISNTEPTNKTPYLYNSIHDTTNPSYGFRNSDLKQDYSTKQQMNAKMIAPSIRTFF